MVNLGAKLEGVAKDRGPLVLLVLSITCAFVLMLLSAILHFGTLSYHDTVHNINKEVGFLSAPNWTIVYAVLFPLFLCLFAVLVGRCGFTLKSLVDARVITGPSGAATTEEKVVAAWNLGLQKISVALWALLIVVVIQSSLEWATTCLIPIKNGEAISDVVDWTTFTTAAHPISPKPGTTASILFSFLAYCYMGFSLFIYLSILVYAAGFALFLNRLADTTGDFRLVLRDVTLGDRLSDIGLNVYLCTLLGLGAGFMMRLQAIYLETNYPHIKYLLFSDILSWTGLLQKTEAERFADAFTVPSEWTSLLEIAFTLLILFAVIYLFHDTFEKARQYYLDDHHVGNRRVRYVTGGAAGVRFEPGQGSASAAAIER